MWIYFYHLRIFQVSDNEDFAKENNHKMAMPNRQDRPAVATEDQPKQSETPRLQLTNGVIKDSPDKVSGLIF